MKKLKLIISKRFNPFFNIETDKRLLHLVGQGAVVESVRFYKNYDSVILGRYQCEELEVNKEYCRLHGIPILKRISGGGAVFHDFGNLNFALYIKEQNMPSKYIIESMKTFSGAIADSLTELGVPAAVGIHGEIIVDGRKVSGCAAAKKFGGFLYHATLLLNADKERLHNTLTPDKNFVPDKKYVRSNRAVIANLYEVKFMAEELIIKTIFRNLSGVFK